MKKIFAIVLSFVMVMGLGITSMAADTKPTSNDTATISVSNVEKGATVTAYQIVKADYNDSGLTGYSKVSASDVIADIYNPTSAETTALAQNYRSKAGTSLTYNETSGKFELTTAAGMYLILVSNTGEKVYNPMLVSLGYKAAGSGSSNELQDGTVDASASWSLSDVDVYAKSSEITITKSEDKNTQNLGGEVNYTVTATVPDYSAEYTDDVIFSIKDTMDGVELKAPETGDMVAVTAVSASGSTITPAYTTSGAAAGATEFTVSFTSAWVKANGGATITLTYTGVLTGDKVNEAAHVNTAQLTYTSEPGATKTASSSVNAYTFEISDGFLKKVTKDKNGTQETIKALAGAEFTLYTDSDCTTQYYNTNYTSAQAYTVISDQDGKLVISGLDAGTYYLKETKAPTGYSLNDTVYTIKVEAVTDTGTTELTSWTISVGDQSTTNTITADGTVTKGAITTTEIMNTKLSALPATGGFGTAIFTAVGCLIMIAAAALFFTSRRKTTK